MFLMCVFGSMLKQTGEGHTDGHSVSEDSARLCCCGDIRRRHDLPLREHQ